MTENGDPYENALAERMNRTIKEEFGMDTTLTIIQQAKQIVEESIFQIRICKYLPIINDFGLSFRESPSLLNSSNIPVLLGVH